jgi:hypothetical protein
MAGGIAVRGNLLAVTWSAARGHVFLFDVEAQQRVSAWTLPVGARGYSDAAGVAMDEHYHLFVADPHNDRVCHFSPFGRHVGDFGTPAPAVGDAGRDRPGVLDRPHAVALRGDLLYVACGDQPRTVRRARGPAIWPNGWWSRSGSRSIARSGSTCSTASANGCCASRPTSRSSRS